MLSLSLSKKSYHYQIYSCLKVKPSFPKKLFQKEKNKLLLWIYAWQLSGHLWFNGWQKFLPLIPETPDVHQYSFFC